MRPVISEADGFDLLVFARSPFPAIVHVVKGEGHARVSLGPGLALLEATGLSDADAARAVPLVAAHQAALLAAWQTPVVPAALAALGEPRAADVAYDPEAEEACVLLATGAAFAFPVRHWPGLEAATPEALADVAIALGGEAVLWPRLGVYARIPELLLLMAGGPGWIAGLAGLGGERAGPPASHQAPAFAPAGPDDPAPPGPDRIAPAHPPAPAAPAPAGSEMARQAAPIRSLLGLILYREGLLDAEQLQAIGREQERLHANGQPSPFGEVAEQLGFVSNRHLRFALHLQHHLSHPQGAPRPLGVYLIESGMLKPSQLLWALEEQKRTGLLLGQILVARGFIDPQGLEAFVARVQAQRAPAAGASPERVKSLLGVILEREGYLSREQLVAITEEQARLRAQGEAVTFGELAIRMGWVNAERLKFAIQLQAKLAYPPGQPKPLGVHLLENGIVAPSQINYALETQGRQGGTLGEVLVAQGALSPQMLEVFLAMQQAQSA